MRSDQMKDVFRIMSFDPGVTCCGWARSEFNRKTGQLNVIRRGKIEGQRSLMRNKDQLSIYGSRIIQLSQLEIEIQKIMKFSQDYVVCEDVYYDPRRPNAYASLLLATHVIEMNVMRYLNKPLIRMGAKTAKSIVTNNANADKETVQETILSHDKIIIKDTRSNPIELMSEHEADSILIGMAFCIDLLPGQILLSSLP